MKNKMLIRFLQVALMWVCFAGCHSYEMAKYDEKPAVNFAVFDSYNGSIRDMPEDMYADIRFTFRDGLQDTVRSILVLLQGKIATAPAEITVKAKAVDKAPTADVSILRKSYIPVGHYFDSVIVVVQCPPLADTVYAVDLVFDYEDSKILPGVAERQVFHLRVTNAVWSSMKITPEIWERIFRPYVGEFSRVKALFMYEIGEMDFPDLADIMEQWVADYFVEELEKYNLAHPDRPLRDEYGHLVTFQPEQNQ